MAGQKENHHISHQNEVSKPEDHQLPIKENKRWKVRLSSVHISMYNEGEVGKYLRCLRKSVWMCAVVQGFRGRMGLLIDKK